MFFNFAKASRGTVALLIALYASPSFASPSSQKNSIHEVVIAGHYVPTPRHQITEYHYELEPSIVGSFSLVDSLRHIPGVSVYRPGGSGGDISLQVRGGEGNFSLVMMDGVAVNNPTNQRGGAYDFAGLNHHSLTKIAFVPGSQSAVYGADGIGGVLQLSTHSDSPSKSGKLALNIGEYGQENAFIRSTHTLNDNWSLSAYAGQETLAQFINGASAKNKAASAQAQYHSNSVKLTMGLRADDLERTSYQEQSGGPLFAVSDELATTDGDSQTYYARLAWQLTPSLNWHINTCKLEKKAFYNSPGIAPFGDAPPTVTDIEYERKDLRSVLAWQFNDSLSINSGIDARQEKGISIGTIDFGILLDSDYQLERDLYGTFVELRWSVSESLRLNISGRNDHTAGSSNQETWKAGLEYALNDEFALVANLGQAFKAPSFFALGHQLVGNPHLRPELADNKDLGFTYKSTHLQARLNYFWVSYEDLIDFDPVDFINVNRASISSHGTEFSLMGLNDTWRWQIAGHYTQLKTPQNTRLYGRPDWQLSANINWDINHTWQLQVDLQTTASFDSASLHTGATVSYEQKGYRLLGTTLRWQLNQKNQLNLSLGNVLNEKYSHAEGFPGNPRNVQLGWEMSW